VTATRGSHHRSRGLVSIDREGKKRGKTTGGTLGEAGAPPGKKKYNRLRGAVVARGNNVVLNNTYLIENPGRKAKEEQQSI